MVQHISEEMINHLRVLALGNLDLVEESLIASLEKVKGPWWRFWRIDWVVNFEKAAAFIHQRTNEIGDVSP